MFFSNEQNTERMSQLFAEARDFWQLQKKYLSLNTAEVLTRILSAIALWGIIILVGSLVLLFGSFALAFWLGSLLDSNMLGFAIIAAVLALLIFMIYANRVAWIIAPTTRFIVNLLASKLVIPTLEAVTIEKEHTRHQLEQNQEELRTTASTILAPPSEHKDKWENVSNLVQNGFTIFRGVQIGLSAIAAARSFFKIGKRRR